ATGRAPTAARTGTTGANGGHSAGASSASPTPEARAPRYHAPAAARFSARPRDRRPPTAAGETHPPPPPARQSGRRAPQAHRAPRSRAISARQPRLSPDWPPSLPTDLTGAPPARDRHGKA